MEKLNLESAIDESVVELEEVIGAFKANPSEINLDDVYRVTDVIIRECKTLLKNNQEQA